MFDVTFLLQLLIVTSSWDKMSNIQFFFFTTNINPYIEPRIQFLDSIRTQISISRFKQTHKLNYEFCYYPEIDFWIMFKQEENYQFGESQQLVEKERDEDYKSMKKKNIGRRR